MLFELQDVQPFLQGDLEQAVAFLCATPRQRYDHHSAERTHGVTFADGAWRITVKWAGSTLDRPETYDGSFLVRVQRDVRYGHSGAPLYWTPRDDIVPASELGEYIRSAVTACLLDLVLPKFADDRPMR